MIIDSIADSRFEVTKYVELIKAHCEAWRVTYLAEECFGEPLLGD